MRVGSTPCSSTRRRTAVESVSAAEALSSCAGSAVLAGAGAGAEAAAGAAGAAALASFFAGAPPPSSICQESPYFYRVTLRNHQIAHDARHRRRHIHGHLVGFQADEPIGRPQV